ncbi:MAG: OmpA family protein [Pseudomonadota bacterium]
MKSRTFAIVALLAITPLAVAQEEATGVTVNGAIGRTMFDSPRGLSDSTHWSAALGYRFDSPLALELRNTSMDATPKGIGTDVEVDYMTLDVLYHLSSATRFKPFVLAGTGKVDMKVPGASMDNNLFNAGVGMKYLFSANSMLRAELRAIRGFNGSNDTDVGVNVGYQYTFGKAASVPVQRDGDDDRDGVPNSRDNCPTTPVGTQVDASGCTLDGDADRDGVKDSADQCPNTPRGAAVNAMGCPSDDDDRDGVRNAADRCPGTPAGVAVDSNGCGPDGDRDGVPNHRDQCPDTAPNALVDEVGCYVIINEAVRITLDVEFDFNSSIARPAHLDEVRKVADFMTRYPATSVTFEGHTDSQGPQEYNLPLSERRAATIGNLLVDRFGIPASRVTTVGYGESRPIASNDTEEGRQRNRRVVAEIKATEQMKKRL